MPVMLERWNDDKMDALDAKVGRLEVGLARTDAKVDRIEADVAKLDTKLDEHRKETKTAFEKGERSPALCVDGDHRRRRYDRRGRACRPASVASARQ